MKLLNSVSRLFHRILVIGVMVGLLSGIVANAKAPEDVRKEVEDALMDLHPTQDASWWKALGPEAPPVLVKMYQETRDTFRKVRLLEGLGYFGEPSVGDFLKDQAQNAKENALTKTSIRSLGSSQGIKEESFISNFLHHKDAHIRLAAAQTLKNMHDDHVDERLSFLWKRKSRHGW